MKSTLDAYTMSSRQSFCAILTLSCFCLPARAHTETKLDFWHSYTHQPDAVPHYSFQIAKYKRGLFFGSCGPSTRSLQWEYDVDLAGVGPVYEKNQIEIRMEGKKIELLSGTITFDSKQEQLTIDLRVKADSSPTNFVGNGAYRIKRPKSLAMLARTLRGGMACELSDTWVERSL